MKYGVLVLGAIAVVAASSTAQADEPTGSVSVRTLPMITIYGKRPPLPSVVVEITRPSAAHEAGRAHDEMRNTWILATEPSELRAR